MHRGVYVLGALSPAPEQRWAAALLAGGKGAALSHTASAGNFGWIQPREVIEISAPKKQRGDERLKIHERKSIDITKHNGLPTTTVAPNPPRPRRRRLVHRPLHPRSGRNRTDLTR